MRLFNQENRICLISDGIPDGCDFVEYHDINDYWDSSVEFDKIYLHLSSNPRDYEMFCFQRWFVIRDFVQKQGFEYFLCVDSDVLLYCDVNIDTNQPFIHIISEPFSVIGTMIGYCCILGAFPQFCKFHIATNLILAVHS